MSADGLRDATVRESFLEVVRQHSLTFCLIGPLLAGCFTEAPPEPELTTLCIDREQLYVVPPSGLQLGFRVQGCDGNPISRDQLSIRVFDVEGADEQEIGTDLEGSAVSQPGVPAETELFTVLVLDVSASIFNNGHQDSVRDAAIEFVEDQVSPKHGIAVVVFSNEVVLSQDFTSDRDLLVGAISSAYQVGGGDSTDLYNAYMEGLDAVESVGEAEYIERSMIVLTDGDHTAGDSGRLRWDALDLLAETSATVFVVPFDAAVDSEDPSELATSQGHVFPAEESGELRGRFREIASRIRMLAESNYVIGVCTPRFLGGDAELRLEVSSPDDTVSSWISYSTFSLDGSVSACDAEEIADARLDCPGETCPLPAPYGNPEYGCVPGEEPISVGYSDICAGPCNVDSDCAAQGVAVAVPVCVGGFCRLECMEADQCHDGAYCDDDPDLGGSYCAF